MVSYNLGWKPGCCLSLFMETRAKEFVKVFFSTFSLSTEFLEDKQRFKLGGVDTSPTYLLFQTILPLFWTLTCMIWMKLTQTDAVFSRTAMVLFIVQKTKVLGMTWKSTEITFGKYKKYSRKNQDQGAHTLSRRVGARPLPLGAPPVSWDPWCSTDLNSNSIYSVSRRKKSKRKFHRVLRYGAAAKP